MYATFWLKKNSRAHNVCCDCWCCDWCCGCCGTNQCQQHTQHTQHTRTHLTSRMNSKQQKIHRSHSSTSTLQEVDRAASTVHPFQCLKKKSAAARRQRLCEAQRVVPMAVPVCSGAGVLFGHTQVLESENPSSENIPNSTEVWFTFPGRTQTHTPNTTPQGEVDRTHRFTCCSSCFASGKQ